MTESERPTSRNIPLPIERAVRQRCGFGCVVCGLPLYDYDHLLGWAQVQRHVAEEITLLCDLHHREKGSGLLTAAAVEAANSEPFNRREGVSRPYELHFEGESCEIDIGGNFFGMTVASGESADLVPISIDGGALLAFTLQDGHLLLSLLLFDEFNRIVLHIRNNQLVFSVAPWDIQLVGRNLVVREAARKILIDIEFNVPAAIRVRRARFLKNGVELNVWPDRVVLANDNATIKGNRMMDCPMGFAIGPHRLTDRAMVIVPNVQRYSHDTAASEAWVDDAFKEPDLGSIG